MANVIARSAVFFGKCVTSDLPKAVKVSVDKYVMDKRLIMYFKEKNEVYAFDKTNNCREGDFVLITANSESEDLDIKYNVEKVIYKRGNLIDPITGKRSAGAEYIDDIVKLSELFNNKETNSSTDHNV